MLDKVYKIIFPDVESLFTYYILPTIIYFIGIILIFVFFLALAKFAKAKAEKWKAHKYQSSFIRRFIVVQKKLIHKSLTACRYTVSLYISLLFISHILESFSSQLKDSFAHEVDKTDKLWHSIAVYCYQGSEFIDKFSLVAVKIFLTVLIAIWCTRILQKTLNIFLTTPVKSGSSYENIRNLAKKNTLNSVTNYLLKFIISIIAVFTILENLGINIAALLATAGLASVAIGFGAQNLVKDFIAGFFILFEDQFTVGDSVDVVTASSVFSGSVEKMTLRMARIRSNEGSLLTIPNGDIRSVKNFTTDWSRIDFKYSLQFSCNLEKATIIFKEEIDKLCQEFAEQVIGAPDIRPMEKIVDFENRSVAISFRFFLKTVNVTSKMKLEREFNSRILARFKSEGIY
ncbi:MAG: mechanosensitive ion channel domain-containing protein [Bdellovibrionota bacterium]